MRMAQQEIMRRYQNDESSKKTLAECLGPQTAVWQHLKEPAGDIVGEIVPEKENLDGRGLFLHASKLEVSKLEIRSDVRITRVDDAGACAALHQELLGDRRKSL